ncbi:MAG: TIGR00159 family protein [Clostridiales bacterium]|nr:TIGR00159 family protein [Clostridiales bacterium]
MDQLTYAWQQLTTQFAGLIFSMDLRNVLDILLVATIVYYVVKLIRQTRANSVLKGLGVILALTWLSGVFQFTAINWLLRQIINTGMVMVVVLFQPELRRGLEQIGRSRLRRSLLSLDRKSRSVEHDAEELVHAMTNLARRRVGALVVLERRTGLKDIVSSGTTIDAEISSALIENIFEPNTPLHDGAVVVRDGRIVAAGCFLPLSEDASISRELGTRHRAALGISETTDAVVLIASEETGILSVAREGRLTRYLDAKSLGALLGAVFDDEPPAFPRALLMSLRRKEAPDEEDKP